MFLLFSIVTRFLLAQGYLEVHPRLYEAVIKFLKEKNVPMTKTVSELWKSRRLSHGLCVSPMNNMLLETFSKYQIQLVNSSELWRTLKEELKPLAVGFHHTIEEIKQAASDIISNVCASSD